ncbi:MAG: MBOAT family O-acyltransferase [Gemmatimonadaceae bacterium]
MSGPTFQFVGFALLVALLMSVNRSTLWRQTVMLLASAVFLATFQVGWLGFAPLAGFLLLGYVALRQSSTQATWVFPTALISILLFFFWIKKYVFVPSAVWLTFPYVTVGVSYMLFRLLHLIIEAKDDPALGKTPFRTYLTYMVGFNTLVAGPIQLFEDYRSEEDAALTRRIGWLYTGEAAERIVIGLFKTNVLAAILAQLRDTSLTRMTNGTGNYLDAALTFGLYPFFLYCNFSGYIDIVVGVTLMMGHRLPENFIRPFTATSVIDFWNRWHITLSRWLRTYVYNPFLMSMLRRFPSRRLESTWAVCAFFLTFFLIGVWHGQTIAFLFFGVLSGFAVSVNKVCQLVLTARYGRKKYERISSNFVYESVGRGLNITWWAFTLTWFWASWESARALWSRQSVGEWLVIWIALLLVITIVLAAWVATRDAIEKITWRNVALLSSRRLHMVWFTALLFIVVAATLLSNQSAPQIVYKDF